ncbi:helix-turn-helix domain-containing protein [Streptomyces sp. AD55]|uniref:helix-turn-helix domain-containing protein n=1 Tax=Streptomyces sp. AD55 TaxID=3242895 RepID=UPI0035293101
MISETPKYERLTGPGRERTRQWLAARYEDGSPIRSLADELDLSYGTVHRLLKEAEVTLRPPRQRARPSTEQERRR